MKLKLPPHMIFHHDLNLLVVRPRGILTEKRREEKRREEKRVDKDIAFLDAAEDEADKPFNRFTDTSQADVTHCTSDMSSAFGYIVG